MYGLEVHSGGLLQCATGRWGHCYRCQRYAVESGYSLSQVLQVSDETARVTYRWCQWSRALSGFISVIVTQKSHCFHLFTVFWVLYVQRRLCRNFRRAPVHKRDQIHTLFTCPELQIQRKLWRIFPRILWLDSQNQRFEIWPVYFIFESVLQGKLCRIFDRDWQLLIYGSLRDLKTWLKQGLRNPRTLCFI